MKNLNENNDKPENMDPFRVSPLFRDHLNLLRMSTDKAFEIIQEGIAENIQGANLFLVDLYNTNPDFKPTLAELNTIAGIIQKIASSQTQLAALYIKKSEHKIKQEEHELKKTQLFESVKTAGQGLSPEVLATIEHQLKLL